MQLPDDLTDNERVLVECLITWVGTMFAVKFVYGFTTPMITSCLDVTGKVVADLIGDQEIIPNDLIIFARDYLRNHAD